MTENLVASDRLGDPPANEPARAPAAAAQAAKSSTGGYGPLWHMASVITGLGLGVGLLLLAHQFWGARLRPETSAPSNIELLATPNPNIAAALVQAIAAGRAEILVSARRLSSEKILAALADRASKGVSVKVILDGDLNQAASSGAVSWLNQHGVRNVFLDAAPNQNQFLVIDSKFIYIGSTPFSADGPTRDASVGLFAANAKLASDLRNYFYDRLAKSRPPQ